MMASSELSSSDLDVQRSSRMGPDAERSRRMGPNSERSRRLGPENQQTQRIAPVLYSDEEVDAMIENFAAQDEVTSKTFSRVVVESFLSKFKVYFPRKDFPNAPSLAKAYAYYEHITLPRHFSGENGADHILRRSEPGERVEKTELYNPFTLPNSSLIEWGIGVDLYFSNLRLLGITLFFAGLLHLPNAIFYSSTDYSPNGGKDDLDYTLQGSAICTTYDWAACIDCKNHSVDFDKIHYRNVNVTGFPGLALVHRNMCKGGQLEQGIVNWVVLVFLLVAIALIAMYLRAREVRFDEDKVSASDYSVIVKNPPDDALDPDEWRDFFEQFTERQVTAVTIALNNEMLVRKLIIRRIHRNNLRMKLGNDVDLDDEDVVRSAVARFVLERDAEPRGCLHRLFDCTVLPIFRLFGMFLPAETLVDKVFQLTEEIKDLQNDKYDATKVFVTFETEEGQRSALTALSVGRLDYMMNNTHKRPNVVFHDTVLKVDEPAEPSAIRWLDLSTSVTTRILWRVLTLGLTVALVAACGKLVSNVRYDSATEAFAGPLVSIFNTVIPNVVKILMIFEPHHSEGSRQTSLYLKITLFRWVNTALLTKFLTPFTSTLSGGDRDVLKQINNILISELWLVPLLRLIDITSNLRKHILAPRARNQEEMNLSFQGTPYNLGERYTDLTKVLFVCFFYSALFPTTFFFGAAILCVQYFTDKYCLTRIWGWQPFLGNELARFSRRYFLSGALLSYALVSAYAWAQFPYDNICETELDGAAGFYANPTWKNGTVEGDIRVSQDRFVAHCGQSWRHFRGFPFPPTDRVQREGQEWMDDSQEDLVNIYGWTSLVMLVIFIITFFGGNIGNFFKSWFSGVYQPAGQDQHIDYSSNPEIAAYVPQIRRGGFPFPFLCCDVDDFDTNLIGWNDPSKSYDHHNVIYDVPWKGMPRERVEDTTAATAGGQQQEQPNSGEDTTVGQQQQDPGEDAGGAAADEGGAQTVEARAAVPGRPIFSVIKHYPPAWVKKVAEMEAEREF